MPGVKFDVESLSEQSCRRQFMETSTRNHKAALLFFIMCARDVTVEYSNESARERVLRALEGGVCRGYCRQSKVTEAVRLVLRCREDATCAGIPPRELRAAVRRGSDPGYADNHRCGCRCEERAWASSLPSSLTRTSSNCEIVTSSSACPLGGCICGSGRASLGPPHRGSLGFELCVRLMGTPLGVRSCRGSEMAKPTVIVVGADKGGVGKTTVARTLLDYFTAHQVATRAFDTEAPKGTLKRFHPDISEVVDVTTVPDQMRIFDTVSDLSVTVIDVRADCCRRRCAPCATLASSKRSRRVSSASLCFMS